MASCVLPFSDKQVGNPEFREKIKSETKKQCEEHGKPFNNEVAEILFKKH